MHRRSFMLSSLAAAGGSVLPGLAAATPTPQAGGWGYDSYLAAMKACDRPTTLTREQFDVVRGRRKGALATIESVLKAHFTEADPNVLRAFNEVPREFYHYDFAARSAFATVAYEEKSKPWRIGFGSALSDYRGQAYMTQLCKPTAQSVALEVGTGSGFQISVLSRIVKKAYSIEIVEPLGKEVGRIFKPLGYDNVETRIGDGFFGWPEEKDGFDLIMVTCAAQFVPPPLLAQLKPGGRMVIPMGQPFKREQFLYVFTKDEDGKVHSRKDLGVYFVPMTGKMLADAKKPAGEKGAAADKPAAEKPAATQ
ncbi:protein-L-isoaspartate O-methyltransferase [Reyranella sp. CPCC 100927]|uniref:protein-L-isoaspartate O-methyltransferase family protein n=1 Tax=Reyranella sp. CPCC 100927 TaxID=2599616 RepID=UPI0011B65F69|nr:protein-L-isoaspartate O-methyltransferase [Reyranella sp. CPCC 100927]TWS96833.1 protein-L-isoaspartate O-methyltransferase [Reyranella sp. CPCC 100927]